MKNKHTILLLGIGLYYLLYKMYSKKNVVVTQTNLINPKLNPDEYNKIIETESHNIKTDVPKQFLIDKTNIEEDTLEIPKTFQTYYAKETSNDIQIPNTYQTYYARTNGANILDTIKTYQIYYTRTNINKGIRGMNTKCPMVI